MPISRASILASKTVLPLAVVAIAWTVAGVLQLSLPATPATMLRGLAQGVLSTSLLLLVSSWLGSTIVDTPLTAGGFCLMIGILFWTTFVAIDKTTGLFSERLGPELSSVCITGAMAVVGACCFASGCAIYVRRVEA